MDSNGELYIRLREIYFRNSENKHPNKKKTVPHESTYMHYFISYVIWRIPKLQ